MVHFCSHHSLAASDKNHVQPNLNADSKNLSPRSYFLSDITRQLHHFSLKLLFLHLPICHLLFHSQPLSAVPPSVSAASATVLCSLFGSIIFLACLFDLWDARLELYLAPRCSQIPLKWKTGSYWCPGCCGGDVCIIRSRWSSCWCRLSRCCLWGDQMSSKGRRHLIY